MGCDDSVPWRAFFVVAAAAMAVSGCAGRAGPAQDSASGPDTSRPERTSGAAAAPTTASAGPGGVGVAVLTGPADSLPGVVGGSTHGADSLFGWGPTVADCVASRTAGDWALRQALEQGVEIGTPSFEALRAAGAACQRELEWSPQVPLAGPGDGTAWSVDQEVCVRRVWATLDAAVVDELVAGAVVPQARTDAAVAVEARVQEECGL